MNPSGDDPTSSFSEPRVEERPNVPTKGDEGQPAEHRPDDQAPDNTAHGSEDFASGDEAASNSRQDPGSVEADDPFADLDPYVHGNGDALGEEIEAEADLGVPLDEVPATVAQEQDSHSDEPGPFANLPNEDGGPWLEIRSSVDGLDLKLEKLRGEIATELNAIRKKDDTVGRLHADLQDARKGIDLLLMRPLFMALTRLHDNMVGDLMKLESTEERDTSDTSVHREELLIALEDNGLTPMAPLGEAVSETFDGTRQSIVRTVDTAMTDQHGKVAAVLTCGFNYDGAPFQKQKVAVYKYKQQPDISSDSA